MVTRIAPHLYVITHGRRAARKHSDAPRQGCDVGRQSGQMLSRSSEAVAYAETSVFSVASISSAILT